METGFSVCVHWVNCNLTRLLQLPWKWYSDKIYTFHCFGTIYRPFYSWGVSHDNWCTGTLLNSIITTQWEGMGDVGLARYEPALLPPCLIIRGLSYCNCQRSPHFISKWIFRNSALWELSSSKQRSLFRVMGIAMLYCTPLQCGIRHVYFTVISHVYISVRSHPYCPLYKQFQLLM